MVETCGRKESETKSRQASEYYSQGSAQVMLGLSPIAVFGSSPHADHGPTYCKKPGT